MDRRTFFKASALGSGLLAVGETGAQEAKKPSNAAGTSHRGPNIVFILSDQHNAKVMGHQGHPDAKTPNLDRLASQGTRFDACISANCICTPSRVSYLSGQYCHNHGYYGLSGPNPGGLPTLLGHFREAGYRTGALGKIHCPENWVEADADFYHDPTGTSVGGRSKEYLEYLKERGILELEDHGGMREFGKRGMQTCEGRPSKVSYRDGQEGWIVTKGIEFMRTCAEAQQPFLLHLSFPKPHQCYTPAQEFWDLYDEASLTLPPNAEYDMGRKAPHLRDGAARWRKGEWTLFEPKTFEAGRLRKQHGYLGNISHVDHAVGEVMAFLDEAGLAEDTILVYASDHGDYACEHGIMEKAPGISSDAITRVPYIWRWPNKIEAGRAIKEVVATVDTANTLCALAGVEAMATADGRDLSAALEGGDVEPGRLGVTEFAWSRSIRQGPWRLVIYPRDMFAEEYPEGFGELYNLDEDPWEMTNLWFDEAHAGKVRELERAFMDFLLTTTRPTTIHGSQLSAKDAPQTEVHYSHAVNPDNKMHFDRVRVAAKHPGYRNYQ